MAAEDWLPDHAFEDEDDEDEEGYRHNSVTCKFCGKTGLRWEDEDGRWVLVGRNYEVHDCRAAAGIEDFDVF